MRLYGPDMKPLTQRDMMALPASAGWLRGTITRSHSALPPAVPPPPQPTFEGIASTGVPLSEGGSPMMVCVDLASLRHKPVVPVHLEHGPPVGWADRLVLAGGGLMADGKLLDRDDPDVAYIRRKNSYGASWFLSLRVRSNGGGHTEFVDTEAEVNGRLLAGPVFVARNFELVEVSLTRHPADPGAVCLLSF